jgi:hypothetical protein
MSRRSLHTVHATFLAASLAATALAQDNKLGVPVLSCFGSTNNTIIVQVCGDAVTGAPAGFSVHWLTRAQYDLGPDGLPNTDDDGSFGSGTQNCGASFSGNANNSNWNLTGAAGANPCQKVVIGGLNDADPGVSFSCNDRLLCDTEYAFRAFAHAEGGRGGKKRSEFSPTLFCKTAACEPTGYNDCDFETKSQGYYGGSGNPGRDTLVGCFGGDPTGVLCTSVANVPIVTIGGGTYTYTWKTTGACVDVQPGVGVFLMDVGLANLRTAVGGGGSSGFFTANGSNATSMGTGGGLASQTAALTLNINLSGAACSGFKSLPGGYGAAVLCKFVQGSTFVNNGTPISAATAAALNGQTVAQVLAAVNLYLGGNGAVPVPYGLANAGVLNELVSQLNLTFHDGTSGCDMSALAENHLCKP